MLIRMYNITQNPAALYNKSSLFIVADKLPIKIKIMTYQGINKVMVTRKPHTKNGVTHAKSLTPNLDVIPDLIPAATSSRNISVE